MNSEPAIATEAERAASAGLAGWLCALFHTTDSLYPTGSYAHSFGLEGLVLEGAVRDRATLGEHLRLSALPMLAAAELPLVAHACDAFERRDWPVVLDLAALSSALRTPAEARFATERIGRQRAELVARLHPASLAAEYVRRTEEAAAPYSATVSAALEAAVQGAPPVAAMSAYAYAALAALIAAAMKLLRLGQNAAHTLLAETLALVPAAVNRARLVPVDAIGWSNPWLDIASARHECAESRMFIS